MASTRASRAGLTVAVLAGLLAPIATAQGLTCTGARDIKFTGALEPLHLDTDHVIGNYGLRGLVVWLHGVFGAIVLPSNDPTEVLKEKRAELASQQYGGVLWGMVKRNVIVVLVILVSLVLCVVLPLVAIVSVAFHRVCSCCKSWTSEYSETVLESRSRKKWTNVFYVLTVLMSFMTLGAIATKTHLSRASEGAVDQSHFLSTALPIIVNRLFEELNVLADTNTKEFKTAVASRADTCAEEAAANADSMASNDPILKFLATTAQHLKTIQEKLAIINASMTGPKLGSVLAKTDRASAALKEAARLSAGSSTVQQNLNDMARALEFSTLLVLPSSVKDLQQNMKGANLQDKLSKIPTRENIEREVKGVMGGVTKGVDDYRAEMVKALQDMRGQADSRMSLTKDSLNTFEDHVNLVVRTAVGWYEIALVLLLFVMILIVGQYIAAIQAQVWHINQGFCGLYMGSWMLWVAVVMFQVLFPVALAVSTITMAVGTVVDRLICLPAQDPGSESSHAVMDYLINLAMKPSARAAPESQPDGVGRQRRATDGTDNNVQEPSLLKKLMESPWQDSKFLFEDAPDEIAQLLRPSNDSGLAPALPESIDADKNGLGTSHSGEISRCTHTLTSESLREASFSKDANSALESAEERRATRRSSRLPSTPLFPAPSQSTIALRTTRTSGKGDVVGRMRNDVHVVNASWKRTRRMSKPVPLSSRDASNTRRHRRRQRLAQKHGGTNATQSEQGDGSYRASHGLRRRRRVQAFRAVRVAKQHTFVSRGSGKDGHNKSHQKEESAVTSMPLLWTAKAYDVNGRGGQEGQRQAYGNPRLDMVPRGDSQSVRRHRMLQDHDENRVSACGNVVLPGHILARCSSDVTGTALQSRTDMFKGQLMSPRGTLREGVDSPGNHRRIQLRKEDHSGEGEDNVPNKRNDDVAQGGRRLQRRDKRETSEERDASFDQRVVDNDPSATFSSWRWPAVPSSWLSKWELDERIDIDGDDALEVRPWPFTVEFAPQEVVDITKRFAKCSSGHMSLFKLLGEDAAVKLAISSLGPSSPIFGLIDSKVSNAKLVELKSKFAAGMDPKMDAQLKSKLEVSDDVKAGLSPLSSGAPIQVDSLTQATKQATTEFGKISQTKTNLRNLAQQGSLKNDAKDKVNEAADELDKITADDEKGFKEAMTDIEGAANDLAAASVVDGKSLNDYLQENIDQWDANKNAMKGTVQSLVDSVKGMTKGFEGDVEQFFNQAKTQVRENIGDCHSIYVIYITTTNTVCDGVVKPFASFWFMVWWYLLLGAPAWMIALALSTYYRKIALGI